MFDMIKDIVQIVLKIGSIIKKNNFSYLLEHKAKQDDEDLDRCWFTYIFHIDGYKIQIPFIQNNIETNPKTVQIKLSFSSNHITFELLSDPSINNMFNYKYEKILNYTFNKNCDDNDEMYLKFIQDVLEATDNILKQIKESNITAFKKHIEENIYN